MTTIGGDVAAALADRYRIERELGAGGMVTVYLAEDLKHHRRVAIKVLRSATDIRPHQLPVACRRVNVSSRQAIAFVVRR